MTHPAAPHDAQPVPPEDSLSASRAIDAPAADVFAVLADPSSHAAVDGTGWVRDHLDGRPLTRSGQIFRMAMYHANHPNGHYEMANRVVVFDPPRAICWEPGQMAEGGELRFGGWLWRYDLTQHDDNATVVTLTYDWSAVPSELRRHIRFPPFPVDHLRASLANLARLVRLELP